MDLRCERGDLILAGLGRTVVGLLMLALLAFEVGAAGINRVQTDDIARHVVGVAAGAWRTHTSVSAVERAALSSLSGHAGVTLEEAVVEAGVVRITVSRPAPVLVADLVPQLRPHLVARVSKSVTPQQ